MPQDVWNPPEPGRPVRTLWTRRSVVRLAGAAGAALVVPPWLTACLDHPLAPAGQELDVRQARVPVEGYADAASYRAGDTASFHISNNSKSRYRTIGIEILRLGAVDEPMLAWTGEAYPQVVPDNAPQNGCGWPVTFQFVIPSTWRSGVYLMRVSSLGDPRDLPGLIFFVIKATNRASAILYQLPVSTYQAYNLWGGGSLYTADAQGYTNAFVSFDRPYRNLHQLNVLDLSFIRWMEREGFGADYCTSVDLHSDPQLRMRSSGYQLLLSVGHDEYWSWGMRDNVEDFIASGGNVAFFGGNTCWWQIRFEPDTRRIVCYKDPQQNTQRDPAWGWGPEGQRRVTTNWFKSPVNRPEEAMTGLSFRYGAGWWRDPPPPYPPFRVGPLDHWAFAGLSLQGPQPALATDGWETDAAHLCLNQDGSVQVDGYNIPVISEDPDDGNVPYRPPDSILILARTDLLSWAGQRGRASMAIYRNNGVVFNAATTDWPITLKVSNPVQTITRNVIQHLSLPFLPCAPLVNLGFDAWAVPSQPDGWALEVTQQEIQQVFREAAVDFTRSTASARINAQAGSVSLTQDFAAIGGRYYAVSGWIRSSGPITAPESGWLAIHLQDIGTGELLATARYTAPSGGWQHVRAYGRAAVSGTTRSRLIVESSFPGDAWFDGLRVDLL